MSVPRRSGTVDQRDTPAPPGRSWHAAKIGDIKLALAIHSRIRGITVVGNLTLFREPQIERLSSASLGGDIKPSRYAPREASAPGAPTDIKSLPDFLTSSRERRGHRKDNIITQ